MSYALGIRALRRLCQEQNPLAWQQAKLSAHLFKPAELPVFQWVSEHVKLHHVLPQVETLLAQFPDFAPADTPEPSSYYIGHVINRFCSEAISKANLDSQEILKKDQNDHEAALGVLKHVTRKIAEQKYRLRILDVAEDAPAMVLTAYHKTSMADEQVAIFGWPYMDAQFGGAMPGDVVSFVGRPAAGKTWQMLWSALQNWTVKKQNVLFVSMEMTTLPIAQRITSMYTHAPIQQLKNSGFSSVTLAQFYAGLKVLSKEEAKFYVIDGNLAATVEDIYLLADLLQCRLVFVDGAYLLRHANARLDRFTRAAENVELIKRHCTDLNMTTFCSWQFNRVASQKQKKNNEKAGLEDIGYTDAIGQISTIVLALNQEDSIETMKARKIDVIKGRNGEVGEFSIEWAFDVMSFQQCDPPLISHQIEELQYL